MWPWPWPILKIIAWWKVAVAGCILHFEHNLSEYQPFLCCILFCFLLCCIWKENKDLFVCLKSVLFHWFCTGVLLGSFHWNLHLNITRDLLSVFLHSYRVSCTYQVPVLSRHWQIAFASLPLMLYRYSHASFLRGTSFVEVHLAVLSQSISLLWCIILWRHLTLWHIL